MGLKVSKILCLMFFGRLGTKEFINAPQVSHTLLKFLHSILKVTFDNFPTFLKEGKWETIGVRCPVTCKGEDCLVDFLLGEG